jgi:hypothetical protein
MARWVTADSLFLGQKVTPTNRKRHSSLYEVLEEEVHLESLYSRTSYFLFLDVETVLKFQSYIGKVPCCLLLPADKYQEVIDALPLLGIVQLISFDSAETNRDFYDFLIGKTETAELL